MQRHCKGENVLFIMLMLMNSFYLRTNLVT